MFYLGRRKNRGSKRNMWRGSFWRRCVAPRLWWRGAENPITGPWRSVGDATAPSEPLKPAGNTGTTPGSCRQPISPLVRAWSFLNIFLLLFSELALILVRFDLEEIFFSKNVKLLSKFIKTLKVHIIYFYYYFFARYNHHFRPCTYAVPLSVKNTFCKIYLAFPHISHTCDWILLINISTPIDEPLQHEELSTFVIWLKVYASKINLLHLKTSQSNIYDVLMLFCHEYVSFINFDCFF